MNRNRYRIIFNQSRGQLMAVAENVSSQSKSAGDTEASSSPSLFGSSRLFKISNLTLAFAIGMSSFNSSYAEIIADRKAPANQQATILRDAADKPLVNIQTPNAAGVSRNTYTKFDVDAKGVTLNNDRGGNPWLAKGAARVILNEVNSSHPSLLAGAIKVRGSRAEVIVANPSGINVNGVSIENASRLTLTTGKVINSNGQLTGIQVRQGGIVVEGAGLNASTADYTELLSRTARIQAKISAKQLAVTTGAQTLDYTSGTLSTENATGAKPVLALDVSQLGGMYAGKISLLSTEAGIGVRNAGILEANQLVLTADGKLENSGKISAAVTSIATVRGDIENSGSINGRDFLMISAGNNANLSGVGMKQDSAAMVLLAKANINLAAGTQIGSNKASSTLSLRAGRDINLAKQSSLAAQGAISLNADGKLNSTEASIVTKSDNITAVAGNGINLQSSQLNAAKNIHLETGKPFAETNAAVQLNASKLTASKQINVISTGDLTLTSAASSATAGAAHVVLLSNRKVKLNAGSKLDAGGNLYIKAGESLLLQGDEATSQKVALSAKGQIDLHGASVELQGSQIRSTGAKADLNLIASKGSLAINTLLSPDLTRANGAMIEAKGKVNINTLAADLSVNGAKISGQTVSLLSAGHLGITGDEMASSALTGKQGLTLATVKGAGSQLYSDGRVKLDAGTWQAWISASGGVSISGHNLQSVDSQGVVATAFTPHSIRGAFVRIDAKSDIDVSGTDITATAGDIEADTRGNFNFTSYGNQPAEYGLNGNGKLNASANVRIHADASASVSGASVRAGKNLALTSAKASAYLDNSLLQAGDVLSVATFGSQSHTFSHLNGGALLLHSEKDKISLLKSQLKTSATRSADVAALSGQLSIDAAGALEWDKASLIKATTDLSLSAGRGNITLSAANTGNLQAGRDLAFSTGSGNLTLATGFNWSAKRDLSLKSKSGKLTLLGTAGNQGSPSAQIVTLKAGGAMNLTGAQVDIQASKLSSVGGMKITSTASDVYIGGIKNSAKNYVPKQRMQYLELQLTGINQKIYSIESGYHYSDLKSAHSTARLEADWVLDSWYREGGVSDTANIDKIDAIVAGLKNELSPYENELEPLRQEKAKFEQALQVLRAPANAVEHTGAVVNASEINITSQQGIDIAGARIQATGKIKLSAAGLLPVNTAGKTDAERLPSAINITSLLDYYEYGQSGKNNYSWAIYNAPSVIKGDAGVTIQATGAKDNSRIILSGAEVNAERGKVHLDAEGDIRLEASQEEFYSYARRIYNTGRWWNRKRTTEVITANTANASESSLNGQSILVKSGGSIDAYSTAFNAPRGNINLVAANALGMWAVQEKEFRNVDENTSRSFWKVRTGSSSSTDSRMVSSFLPSKLVAERIATDSGWDTRLQGTIFQSSLAGAVIQAGVGANARADAQIILEGIKTTIETSKTSESDSVVWQKKVGVGGTTQTMALPTFTGPTAPVFSAPGGITAQIPDGELKTQVTQLANQPGMAYLQALSTRTDVNWKPVKLAYDQWQYEQEGLTPAGAALVAIAVAVASGGTGVAAGGNLLNSMVGAAFASLDALVAITLINNKGDIGQTLRDLGRSDTVKSMLTAALTAGALNTVGGLPSMEGLKRAGQFTDKLTMNLVNSSTSAAINTAINGGSLEDALKSASLSAVVSTAHGEIAGEIKNQEFGYLAHKLAHAAAGCAAGAAVGGECRDGAIGSAVGEMTAELFEGQKAEAYKTEAGKAAFDLKVLATSKIVAGALTAYTGGNAQTAINTAETAVQNNFLAAKQLEQMQKELKGKSLLEQLKIRAKWAGVSLRQDGFATAGLGKGLAEAGWNDVEGMVEFLKDPVAGLNGIKQLVTSAEVRQKFGDTLIGDLNSKITRMETALTVGGDAHAEQFGKDLGGLIWQVGSVATGVGGAATAGTKLAKIGIKFSEKSLESLVGVAKFDQLVEKGGIFKLDGTTVMDFRSLTSPQKGIIGDLLGGEKINQLVPSAQKIGRTPGIGATGIDDLYKVSKLGVDYIAVEYKFGSSVLKNTIKDGMQMSDTWLFGKGSGYNRILESVANDQKLTNSIDSALRAGRVEKWLVHTDPFGRVTVGVLDKEGRFFSDPRLASKILGNK